MCEYCELNKTKKDNEYKYDYMKNLPILDDYDEKLITGLDRQVQYIRESKETKSFNLITELNNDDGDVLNLPIYYCPICGRDLKNN